MIIETPTLPDNPSANFERIEEPFKKNPSSLNELHYSGGARLSKRANQDVNDFISRVLSKSRRKELGIKGVSEYYNENLNKGLIGDTDSYTSGLGGGLDGGSSKKYADQFRGESQSIRGEQRYLAKMADIDRKQKELKIAQELAIKRHQVRLNALNSFIKADQARKGAKSNVWERVLGGVIGIGTKAAGTWLGGKIGG